MEGTLREQAEAFDRIARDYALEAEKHEREARVLHEMAAKAAAMAAERRMKA